MQSLSRYERAMNLFLRARDLCGPDREPFIRRECDTEVAAEVRSLLRHDQSPHAALRTQSFRSHEFDDSTSTWAPSTIGGCRIVRQIGEGGMGIVFEAIQTSPQRTIAIKVLRPGWVSAERLRRFQYEALALARLEHTAIARIYQTGEASEGALRFPYIAMELVAGKPLTEHARSHALTLRQRVALLANVCNAVQYAHQKGIIHRDLKPANILVDASGGPKILDFGIARLVDLDDVDGTVTGEVIGTPPYLSPEQASGVRGTVDTRSDVYSLGVILAEVLIGQRPERAPNPTRCAQREALNQRASLPADLRAIVTKAMADDPDERYQSAADLGADLEHFLAHRPVVARQAGILYQLLKFTRRRAPIALTIGAVVATFAIGAGLTAWQAVRAGAAMRRAETAVRLIEAALEPLGVHGGMSEQHFKDTLQRIEGECEGEPLLLARVSVILGSSLINVCDFRSEYAQELLTRGLQTLEEAAGPGDMRTIAAVTRVAHALDLRFNAVASEGLWARVVAFYRALPTEHTGELLTALRSLAFNKLSLGKCDEAIDLYGEAIAIDRSTSAQPDARWLDVHLLGWALARSGRTTEGLQHFNDVDDGLRLAPGAISLRCQNLHAMAVTFTTGTGDITAAEECLQLAAALQRGNSQLDADAPAYALRHAGITWARGDYEAALTLFQEIADGNERFGPWAGDIFGQALCGMGLCLRDLGQLEKAEPMLRQVLQIRRARYGDQYSETMDARLNLAKLLLRQGNYDEAGTLADAALSFRRQRYGPETPQLVEALAVAGLAACYRDEWDSAWSLLDEAQLNRSCFHLEPCWPADLAVDARCEALTRVGSTDEARQLAMDEAETCCTALGPDNLATIRARNRLVRLGLTTCPER
jgi:tetratricopeptide (TPR) repeat protein